MKRRDFLKISGLTIGSGAFALYAINFLKENNDAPMFESYFLPAASHGNLLALSRFILPKSVSAETSLEVLKRMDEYASQLSPAQKDELLDVINLLDSNILVRTLTSTASDLNDKEKVENMLNTWKTSFDHLMLGSDLRLAYRALTDLYFLGFYSLKEGKEIAGY